MDDALYHADGCLEPAAGDDRRYPGLRLERFEKKLYGMDCIQCGSCTFACPAKRPLTPVFKQAKAEILENRKREGGGQK